MGRARKQPTSQPVAVADLPDGWLGQIHQGDCVASMSRMPDACVNLAFADPPFNIGYEYDEYDDLLDSEKYLTWSRDWMAQVHRILCANGAFWLAIGDEYAAELKIEAQKLGFSCRSWVIWYYTFGVHCTAKFTRSHAHMFHFVKDNGNFVFNADAVKVPSARQLVYNDTRAASGGRLPDDTWILRPEDCTDGFQPDEDTWYFPRVAGTFKERKGFHGCQMPEQLLGRIIRSCSNENDVVFDPFSGSQTTLAAAKKLNRRFLGCELSGDYATFGTKRLDLIEIGDPLDGAEDPMLSAPKTGAMPNAKRTPSELGFGFHSKATLPRSFSQDATILIQAFANVNRGFSADRVVADPILNEDFQTECTRLSVEGTEAERNRTLFRLRKAGWLKKAGIATSQQTSVDTLDLNQFVFASEIAWRQIEDRFHLSLDEIFCDPRVARQFDEIALRFAPGFTPLEYRWAALKLRKDRRLKREIDPATAKRIGLQKLTSPIALSDFDIDKVPKMPGVYGVAVLASHPKFLYAADTTNLHVRLRVHFDTKKQKRLWGRDEREISIYVEPLTTLQGSPKKDVWLHSRKQLYKWHDPAWNINWAT